MPCKQKKSNTLSKKVQYGLLDQVNSTNATSTEAADAVAPASPAAGKPASHRRRHAARRSRKDAFPTAGQMKSLKNIHVGNKEVNKLVADAAAELTIAEDQTEDVSSIQAAAESKLDELDASFANQIDTAANMLKETASADPKKKADAPRFGQRMKSKRSGHRKSKQGHKKWKEAKSVNSPVREPVNSPVRESEHGLSEDLKLPTMKTNHTTLLSASALPSFPSLPKLNVTESGVQVHHESSQSA